MAGPTRLSGIRRSMVKASTMRCFTQSAVHMGGRSSSAVSPASGRRFRSRSSVEVRMESTRGKVAVLPVAFCRFSSPP